jgi:Lon protease-like protein
MQQLGVLQINARGERRFRILERRVQADGLARAAVQLMDEDGDAQIPAHCTTCVRLLERIIEQPGAPRIEPPHRLDSSAWVSARLAEILPLPLAVKQELLELGDGRARLERLNGFLTADPGASAD